MDHSLSSDDLYRPDFPSLGLFSTWFGVVLIGVTAVLQTGQSNQGSSWADPLVEGLQFVLLALILASLFYLPFRAERGVKWAALPLAINLFTLIIVQLVPFADLWETARFQVRLGQYEAVVALVEAGELVPGESWRGLSGRTIPLPVDGQRPYRHSNRSRHRHLFLQRAQRAAQLFRLPLSQRQQPAAAG
jgi:hypothetical protein